MARPRKDQTFSRTRRYTLRLSEHEHAQLLAVAQTKHQSPAELLRMAFSTTPALAPEGGLRPTLDAAVVIALNRVGSNLNQIARRIHSGDVLQPGELPDTLTDLASVLARIETLVFAAIEV